MKMKYDIMFQVSSFNVQSIFFDIKLVPNPARKPADANTRGNISDPRFR